MKYDFLALWFFSEKNQALNHPFLQASVPMKISGTSALKPSTRRWNSARVYSRTMARKTASEPDCTGTWRYSKTLGRFKTCFANKNPWTSTEKWREITKYAQQMGTCGIIKGKLCCKYGIIVKVHKRFSTQAVLDWKNMEAVSWALGILQCWKLSPQSFPKECDQSTRENHQQKDITKKIKQHIPFKTSSNRNFLWISWLK